MTGMKSGKYEVNRTTLYVEVQGEGKPLLMLHGGYCNLRVWDEAAKVLSRSFRVIRFDHRGYGKSGAITEPFSYYEDIKGILDLFGVPSADIAASSFGGAAALDFALAYPDRVRRLVLSAPSVYGSRYPLRLTIEGMLDFLRARRIGAEQAAEKFIRNRYWRYLVPAEADKRDMLKRMYKDNSVFFTGTPSLHRPLQPHAVNRLEEVSLPALIIEAGRDLPYNRGVCTMLNDRLPNSVLRLMEDSGHYPHLERPAEFAALTADFLA